MDELIIILVRGIGLGAVFSLVAMSFNVVHNSSGILNFAQGNMLVLGGLFGFFTLSQDPELARWLLLVPAAALLFAAVLAAQGYVTLLPLRSSVEQHSWLITTLAVSVIIGAVILIAQGPHALSVKSPFRQLRAARDANADAIRAGDRCWRSSGMRCCTGSIRAPSPASR